jgi:hypothetical protein
MRMAANKMCSALLLCAQLANHSSSAFEHSSRSSDNVAAGATQQLLAHPAQWVLTAGRQACQHQQLQQGSVVTATCSVLPAKVVQAHTQHPVLNGQMRKAVVHCSSTGVPYMCYVTCSRQQLLLLPLLLLGVLYRLLHNSLRARR